MVKERNSRPEYGDTGQQHKRKSTMSNKSRRSISSKGARSQKVGFREDDDASSIYTHNIIQAQKEKALRSPSRYQDINNFFKIPNSKDVKDL